MGSYVGEYKSGSGLVRARVRVEKGEICFVKFTGDFFFFPEEELDELESELCGLKLDFSKLERKINDFFERKDVSVPGMTSDDWIMVMKKALEDY